MRIVIKKDRDSRAGFWTRVEKPAKVLSLVALPLVVAVGGWWVQRSVATQAVNKDYVTIAISLLDASKEVDPGLRNWAVDLLNKNAPVQLDEAVADKLRKGELGLAGILEGRQFVVRNRTTNLTRLIAHALLRAAPEAEVSVYNSGSIRIDALVPAKELTLETIGRILPFKGNVAIVEMPGSLLERMLEQGRLSQGQGSFLHGANFTYSQQWMVNGKPIEPERLYKVAMNDFLLTGGEMGLEFLHNHPEIKLLRHGESMQDAMVNELLSRVEVPQ
jgi:2',3'-cyclic-nucleotide 2'-phosphodiesterase (5'-nucleotidase family)